MTFDFNSSSFPHGFASHRSRTSGGALAGAHRTMLGTGRADRCISRKSSSSAAPAPAFSRWPWFSFLSSARHVGDNPPMGVYEIAGPVKFVYAGRAVGCGGHCKMVGKKRLARE